MCRDAHTGAIALNFGMRGDIADVIIRAILNGFRGFGVLTPPILPFSIGLAGPLYNSVSTTLWYNVIRHDTRNYSFAFQFLQRAAMQALY